MSPDALPFNLSCCYTGFTSDITCWCRDLVPQFPAAGSVCAASCSRNKWARAARRSLNVVETSSTELKEAAKTIDDLSARLDELLVSRAGDAAAVAVNNVLEYTAVKAYLETLKSQGKTFKQQHRALARLAGQAARPQRAGRAALPPHSWRKIWSERKEWFEGAGKHPCVFWRGWLSVAPIWVPVATGHEKQAYFRGRSQNRFVSKAARRRSSVLRHESPRHRLHVVWGNHASVPWPLYYWQTWSSSKSQGAFSRRGWKGAGLRFEGLLYGQTFAAPAFWKLSWRRMLTVRRLTCGSSKHIRSWGKGRVVRELWQGHFPCD